jgi:glyoxylase-like metal-dependent hydrolase (beta-lactamase superfamily II)
MIRATGALALALALIAAAAAPPACAAEPELKPVKLGATAFKIGDFDAFAVRDASIDIPNDAKIFGLDAGPAAVGAVLAKAGAPTDKIHLSIDALLVKANGRVVLLDTGVGPGAHGVLMDGLAWIGVKPQQVSDVLITHAHFDHTGGLVGADGKSVFPKAVVHLSTKEWAYMQAQVPAIAKAIAAQVKTFEPGQTVVPGITAVAIDGHTPGHVGYEIESRGDRLLDIGDMAHSSIISLAEPDWIMGFDGDRELARKSRRDTLARLAKNQERVFAPHFPYPGVGVVQTAGEVFAWVPDLDAPED